MDSASEEIYFQKLQELIEDDVKIVTVSSLASDLGVSFQNSRHLISKYVEDQRKLRPGELAVTYVVSGTLKENARKGVLMVRENDLKEKRNLFEADPCQVIYSVQKNKNVDFNIIALVDMFDSTKIRESALQGSIVSKNCVKRILRFKKLPSPPPPTLKGKSSFFVPKVEASASSEKSTVSPKGKASGGITDLFKAAASKPKRGNESISVKSSKPAAKAGGLAGFLSNGAIKSAKDASKNCTQNEKKTMKTEHSQNSIKQDEIVDITDGDFDEEPIRNKKQNKVAKKGSTLKTEHSSNNSESQNSIKQDEIVDVTDVGFDDEPVRNKEENKVAKKGSTVKTQNSSNNSESQNSIKDDEIVDITDVDFDEEPVRSKEENKVTKKGSTSKNSERKNNSHEKSKANKRQRDKSRELPSKKRKRIVERNSSDSDDMFEKVDDDVDIIDRSDEEPERVPSPVQKPIMPKNKRRKAVMRNYEDEEGFIVTKTEYVYETASEDENVEPEPPKQEKKEEKPANKSKVANKKKPVKNQATLMSFFTKK